MSKLDPAQTLITLPDEIRWTVSEGHPLNSVETAVMAGGVDQEGAYLTIVRWYPGWWSAPHTYVTDRLCVVVSGVWWCNSGPDFDPAQAVGVYPGGFVRRVAGTPHYDGVRADAPEPAVIAVSGIGPVGHAWADPLQRGIRQW